MTIDKLDDRRSLSKHFDSIQKHLDGRADSIARDKFAEEAYQFVSGPTARRAFDISKEDPRLRDQYGRHPWGQSTLLARRLAEAGCTFSTVHLGGWDHHWDLKKSYVDAPPADRGQPGVGVFLDLDDRGLLEETLVILCGEFGRTPKMNDGGNGGPAGSMGTPGRDHWGNAMFCPHRWRRGEGRMLVGSTDRARPAAEGPTGHAEQHPRDDL